MAAVEDPIDAILILHHKTSFLPVAIIRHDGLAWTYDLIAAVALKNRNPFFPTMQAAIAAAWESRLVR